MNVSDLDALVKRALHGNYALPAGALGRIHVFLGGEEADYATGDVGPQDDGPVTGVVTLLTRTRVVHATVSYLAREYDGPIGDVDVKAWPRSLLRTVSIPNIEHDSKAWADDPSRTGRWPDGAQLVLSYGDDALTIKLPAAEGAGMDNRSELWALIPSLLKDLNN